MTPSQSYTRGSRLENVNTLAEGNTINSFSKFNSTTSLIHTPFIISEAPNRQDGPNVHDCRPPNWLTLGMPVFLGIASSSKFARLNWTSSAPSRLLKMDANYFLIYSSRCSRSVRSEDLPLCQWGDRKHKRPRDHPSMLKAQMRRTLSSM